MRARRGMPKAESKKSGAAHHAYCRGTPRTVLLNRTSSAEGFFVLDRSFNMRVLHGAWKITPHAELVPGSQVVGGAPEAFRLRPG